jgi:hypothetical protein
MSGKNSRHIQMIQYDKYIVNLDSLLNHPEILLRAGNRSLVIPKSVIDEFCNETLNMSAPFAKNKFQSLLRVAAEQGALINVRSNSTNKLSTIFHDGKLLSNFNYEISSIAIDFAKNVPPSAVCVITSNPNLISILDSHGIRTISVLEFLTESANDQPNKKLQSAMEAYLISQDKDKLLFGILLSMGVLILINKSYLNISYLISLMSVWGTVIALPFIGILLFWYRQKFRFSYGVSEFFAGVLMTYYIFFPDFSYTELTTGEGIQLLGGLYVMVRGLDNISTGLVGTSMEPFWKKLFG